MSRSSAAGADVPRYISCIEIPGWSKPPFSFEGVTMRTFPLRADPHVLQRLVDRSLNIFPREARFRVFLPYVYLMILDYGKMSIDAANLGWIAQHEVTFSIPLEWYAPGPDGKMHFKDWGYYSPFIFVDNALSMTVGRQVYGWPKKLAYFNEAVNNWARDPRLPANLAEIRTGTYLQLYAGQRPDFRTYLEVEQQSIGSLLGFPLDPEAPWLPWRSIPTAISASLALAGDWVEILRGMQLLPSALRGEVREPRAMLSKAARMLGPSSREMAYNTLNLKEFRDAELSDRACYQAITNAEMKVTRFNGGGMLGDLRVLAGDPTGGMRVRLYDYPSLPIVKTMGLKTRSESAFDGTRVYTLEPVFPFWMDVNMSYNLGKTLVSYPPRKPKAMAASSPAASREPEVAPIAGAAGLSGQEVTGPFEFGNAIVRVLPLRADRGRLKRLCDRYLNEICAGIQDGFSVEPWGEYVYLVANSYGEMASRTNNVGWWAERELTFYMPVLVYGAPGEDGVRPLRTTALVPVLAYADSSTAAFSGAEVSGLPMMRAAIESPPSTWMDQLGPADQKTRNLLRLRTIVLPVLGLGQAAEERTLVEVVSGEVIPSGDPEKRRTASQKWSPLLRDEVQSRHALDPGDLKVGRALAAELLSGALSFNVLTLKEFRDCETPELACYQALVNLRYRLQDVLDLREIEEPLHVRIREYPSQPIVETLGLVPRSQDYEDGTVVYNVEALRPFWMKVNLHVSLGQNLHWRTIKRGWHSGAHPWRGFFDPGSETGALVRTDLDEALEGRIPRDLTFAVREWKARQEPETAGEREAFLAEAEKAVTSVGPQPVLETLLSREWENHGRTRWAQELEAIRDELLRRARAPGTLSQKLADLDGLLEQIEKTLRRRTTHDRIRRELLGDQPAGLQPGTGQRPGALQRLREELARFRLRREAGEAVPQVPEETAEAVESWFEGLQNPSEGIEPADPEESRAPAGEETLPALAMKVAFWLMRARQKPDFCVRREALLDLEVDPEDIYDGWYVGEESPSGAAPSPEAPPAIPGDRIGERLIKRAGG